MNNPGILYIVATPIGNLADISANAITILKQVDLIAAEDTRHSAHLLRHYTINTPTLALHEHNEQQRLSGLLQQLENGKNIALISDAGTPLISDPGYSLVRAARQHGIKVVPIPGPSALITALSVAGLPSDRFVFEGFLPTKAVARKQRLQELALERRTLIFYEAPHRVLETITDMAQVFGYDRYAVVARELTKAFETIHGDMLEALQAWLIADANQQRGEFVILVKGVVQAELDTGLSEAIRILDILLTELPVKQAASLAAKITGRKKNELYNLSLKTLKDGQDL